MNMARRPEQPVVIVDDEADSREALALLLKHEGYRVVTAADGQEALAYLHRSPPPCLILLDLQMPVMDGEEFLRRQQAEESLARIPVLVISGRVEREQTAAIRGAVGCFTKPVRIEALLGQIDQCCRPHRAGSEEEATEPGSRG